MNRTGSTLVLNVLVMTVFAMTAVIVYASAKAQVQAVVHDAREAQAQAIAEAGLEDAMHGIYLDPLWRTGFVQKPFADGYYTVTLSSADPPFIVSTGYSANLMLTGRAVKTVSALVEYTAGACPYAVMAAGNGGGGVDIEGRLDAYDITTTLTPSATEFTTGATVRSNNSIVIGGEACPPPHVYGDVTYVTSGPADPLCVTGLMTPTTTTLNVADFPEPATNDNATGIDPPSAYSGGVSQKLDVNAGQTVTLSTGTYVFKQINIASTGVLNVDTSSGSVTIYLKNNFNATAGCQVNNLSLIPGRFRFLGINGGNFVRLKCSTPLHAYLEGNQANFELAQEMYGHFCSNRVEISSATGAVGLLHYDLGGGGLVSHVKWTTGVNGSWGESYLRQ